MKLKTNELYWAAGLFEGEGTFYWNGKSPALRLKMTDRDAVERFCAAIGMGKVRGPYESHGPLGRGLHYKPTWSVTITGFEKFQAVVAMLWHGLGSRRKQRAVEMLHEETL